MKHKDTNREKENFKIKKIDIEIVDKLVILDGYFFIASINC